MKSLRFAALLFATALTPAFAAQSGLNKAEMDPATRPQDDLFGAMNSKWLAETAIPADKSGYGVWHILDDLSRQQTKTIVENLAKAKHHEGVEKKVAAFYHSFMDTKAIDRQGLKPAGAMLGRIDDMRSTRDLASLLGELQGVVETPVPLTVGADDKNATNYVPVTWQAGTGMPDRDYFLVDNPKFAEARKAYLTYLTTLLKLSGNKEPGKAAKEVFAFEKELAQAQWDKVELRDPVKAYNPMSPAELAAAAPGLDWALVFASAGITWTDKIVVSQPSYVAAVSRMAAEKPLDLWQHYLRIRVLDSMAATLPKAYRDAAFTFHGTALQGKKVERPRWQRATAALDGALGEAVGQAYVSKYFPAEHKARMKALVANLMAAYRQSIDALTWMSPETKRRAHEKLASYTTKIGYPDTWRDYSALEIRSDDAFGNDVRAGRFEFMRKAKRAGQKVDRGEWGLTPQTVNAYYNPNLNEIVFPAAILQPPFFDMAADDAANYGAIGAVIGHEISHGFDDQGSQFDGEGNLNNWWTEDDRKAFTALGDKLVEQYNSYEPLPGHPINGKLTLGENIADLSGLQIAHKAYLLSLAGKPAPVIDGFSGEQRLFLSWAKAWRTKLRDQVMLEQLTADPHSPDRYRANGAAVNADGFHSAFATRAGDKMFKPVGERIRIW